MPFRDLWSGELPLGHAFWDHAVLNAALASLLATIAAYILIAEAQMPLLALAISLLPAPYVIVTIVGVWRSAERYQGPEGWSVLSRMIAPLWGGLMILL